MPPFPYTRPRQRHPSSSPGLSLRTSSFTIVWMRAFLLAVAFILVLSPVVSARTRNRVAVQPIAGDETEPIRKCVARIVAAHGFVPVLSIPAVQGTSQYPGLAKEKRLSAFVVADVTRQSRRVLVSFVVWQGIDGNVVGKWEVSASSDRLTKRLQKEFWKKLGVAIETAKAHPSDRLPPAPTMRINAGTPL